VVYERSGWTFSRLLSAEIFDQETATAALKSNVSLLWLLYVSVDLKLDRLVKKTHVYYVIPLQTQGYRLRFLFAPA